LTYAGAYTGNERVPVDRLLRREGHPLGVRRDEATAIAAAEAEEAATSSRKWTFGVAAGALLMAGTFAAGALGITGGATPVANTAPEHAPAAPGHGPQGGAPVVGAPAPGQQQDPQQQETKPASAGQDATAPAPRDGSQVGNPGGGSGRSGGGNGGGAPAPAPAPAPQPAPQQPAPQQPAPPAQQQGPLGQVVTPIVDTVDDVLSPVTDIVGGLLSPLSAGPQATAQSSAPAGPALTMINPLGDLLGG